MKIGTIVRVLLILAGMLAMPVVVVAQTGILSSRSITANGQVVCWDVVPVQSLTITATGTWVGTLEPQASNSRTGVPTAIGHAIRDSSGAVVNAFTDNQRIAIQNYGYSRICIGATAWTSGTVVLNATSGYGISTGANSSISIGAVQVETPNGDSVTDEAADAIKVAIVSGAGAGGTASQDDAVFTPGTTSFTPSGGIYRSTRDLVDDNDTGAFAMTIRRALFAALETPNGDSVMDDTNDSVKVTLAGTNALTTVSTVTAVTAITNALPAGNNNIGDVDVASLPSVTVGAFPDNEPFNYAQVGGNAVSVGNGVSGTGVQRVTIASDSTGSLSVTQSTAANLNAQVIGSTAHDSPVSGNPVHIGGFASTAVPSATSADGDVTRLWLTRNGAVNAFFRDSVGDSLANDALNALNVNIVGGPGGGVALVDDGSFTVATSSYTPAGGIYRSTLDAVDDGDGGAFAMTPFRALHVSFRRQSDGAEVSLATDSLHDSPVTTTGPGIMLEASVDISANTAVADGDATRAASDVLGRSITIVGCDPGARIGGTTTITDGSSTAATGMGASGAGIRNEVYDVLIANTSATPVTVDLRDGVAGAVLASFPVPANHAGVVFPFSVPRTGTANTAIAIDPSAAATSISVTLSGCKAK